MIDDNSGKIVSAIFVTFSGNCRKALTYYQACFGGTLQFETFEGDLQGYTEMPVVSGTLVSDRIVIHGSDLVHNEGRTLGNYMSIYLHCPDPDDRRQLIEMLVIKQKDFLFTNSDDQKLVEIIDAFEVRWVLGV
ncbi:VOC family protein [Parapedobacter deserti]|uniref:VOC family protein n=1 Tax=Parapedobacter deserti TaxID=1912957 RepID=A0ABV7JSZ0_9SPHI